MSALDVPVAEPMRFSLAWAEADSAGAEPPSPLPWTIGLAALGQADTYWLATVRPGGQPHAVPVLGVVVDGALHFCANASSRKARNLAHDPRCAVNAHGGNLDLAVEATATPLASGATLERVAQAYAGKYGWQPRVHDGALWADGAPTAGPPPYRVYRLVPTVAFGFPTDDASTPTRWQFEETL